MAFRAAARPVEIHFARARIACLQIVVLDGAAAALSHLGQSFLVVHERSDRRDVGVAEGERGHPLVAATRANERTDPVAADVFSDERRPGESRGALAACR